MANVLIEVLESQEKKYLMHSEKLLIPKLAYVFATIAAILLWRIEVEIVIIAVNALLHLYTRTIKLLLYTLALWIATSAVIIAVDYLFATLSLSTIILLIHGYASFTSMALFVSTTPPHQLRELMGLNTLTLTYTLLRSTLQDLIEAIDSLKSRGWRESINVLSYIKVVYIASTVILIRMKDLEESLAARGLER
ncbi:MAG: hypothetical protein N3E36_03600 [Sulfolobales archaeon]|nr:hypothetical protein [Sulfolobales archaeon]MCX8199098.1 hypothetical protein [Sulfolobales archaeon]MDW8170077.1 hypothetical protein [Desulfurococcaceae archaeon]